MLKAALKGVFAHKLRLALTALSIMLGVGFVASAFIFTDTINRVFENLFTDAFSGIDVEVRVKDEDEFEGSRPMRISEELIPVIEATDGVEHAFGSLFGFAQLVGPDDELISSGGAPSFAAGWVDRPDATAFVIRSGKEPGKGEVVVDVTTAGRHEIEIGDEITLLGEREPQSFSVVGTAGFGSADSIAGAVFTILAMPDAQMFFDAAGEFDRISVLTDPSSDPDDVATAIQEVLPERLEAVTAQSAAEAAVAQIKDQLGFFQTFLLVFAGVALFVGTFIIQNTFRIIVAQRTRELALFRAMGAYPAQIVGLVVIEALMVGIIASTAGVFAGMGLAVLLKALLETFGGSLPEGPLVIMTRTIVIALLVGTTVTLISALLPARRASKVPPVAAMRDVDPVEGGSFRTRLIVGSLAMLLGGSAVGWGLFGTVPDEIPEISVIGVGAGLTFIAIAVFGPFFAPPLARILGWPIAKVFRLTGNLSKENSIRNPHRTSATAAALMIGVALVTVVTILAESVSKTAETRLEDNFKADLVVTASGFSPFGFSSEIAPRLEELGEVDVVYRERTSRALLEGRGRAFTGVDVDLLDRVGRMLTIEGDLDELNREGTIAFLESETEDKEVGDTVEVEFAFTGKKELEVVAVYGIAGSAPGGRIISLETFDSNFIEAFDSTLLILLADGVSLEDGEAAIGEVLEGFPSVGLQDPTDLAEEAGDQLDGLLSFIQALLGLAIVIAVLGITNTLSLSIIERTREIGLLRAIGMSRRQIRRIVRWEAVIIASFGGVIGVVVGLGFARAVVSALADQGLTEFSIPSTQIMIWLASAGLAGMIAAILPAWRASRLDVLDAISYE